jgi:uncharacterized membrane protein YhaH (DUF805 family)
MSWYLEVLKKYAVFAGRSGRSEFWYFMLFNFVVYVVLYIVDSAAGTTLGSNTGYGVISGIYALAVLLPGLGVEIRRLHDTDRSGWWVLLGAIPIVGTIVLIVYWAQEGDSDTNQYGASPDQAPALA